MHKAATSYRGPTCKNKYCYVEVYLRTIQNPVSAVLDFVQNAQNDQEQSRTIGLVYFFLPVSAVLDFAQNTQNNLEPSRKIYDNQNSERRTTQNPTGI